jgi:hypothetical protein
VDYSRKLLERYAVARYQELFGNVEANPMKQYFPVKQCLEQDSEKSTHTLGLVIVATMFASFILVLLVLRLYSLA